MVMVDRGENCAGREEPRRTWSSRSIQHADEQINIEQPMAPRFRQSARLSGTIVPAVIERPSPV